MTAYTITANNEFNSIEINFSEKPSDAIRAALKDLRFRWHGVKKVWYGYTTEEAARKAIDTAEGNTTAETAKAEKKPAKAAEKVNKYGVKVGDIFEASWGYDQTNVDFFQVVALVGETSVRVREVYLPMIEEEAISGMSADRTYKLTTELLPPATRSVFIKDQENGDIKRITPGYDKDPEEAKKNCRFKLESFASAHKCNGETIKTYESWYR